MILPPDAGRKSAAFRRRRKDIKDALCDGRMSVEDLLRDVPDEALTMTLLDVIRSTRRGKIHPLILEALGKKAMIDGVNLLVTLGRASDRSKGWLVRNVRTNRRHFDIDRLRENN